MSSNAKFWDKIANKYAASPIKNVGAYEQTMDRTRAYLSQDDTVLEVGCGTGSTALLLADTVKHITASDISANMIEIGKDKAQDQNVGNVTFVQGTPLDDTVPRESVDAVLAYNFLHLVEDLPAVVRNIHGALKPGGVFISKTVCLAEQTRLWAVPLYLMRLVGYAPYVSVVTAQTVENAITEASFEIVETALYPPPISRFVVAKKI